MIERHPRPWSDSEHRAMPRRVAAFVLDAIIVALVGYAWLMGLVMVFAVVQAVSIHLAYAVAALGVLAFLAFWVYYAFLMEGHVGRTVGKAVFGLVVVKADGSPCTTSASVLRDLCWLIDMIGIFPFVIGLVCFVTDRHQRVGDMAADTVVAVVEPDWVREWETSTGDDEGTDAVATTR